MADWMRSTVQSTLGPAKATIKTRVETRTPTGGTLFTYVNGPFGYCSIGPMTTEELELSGRMGAKGTVSCRVASYLDVNPHDRISITDTGVNELDGIWEVTAIMTGFPVVDRLLFLGRVQ